MSGWPSSHAPPHCGSGVSPRWMDQRLTYSNFKRALSIFMLCGDKRCQQIVIEVDFFTKFDCVMKPEVKTSASQGHLETKARMVTQGRYLGISGFRCASFGLCVLHLLALTPGPSPGGRGERWP
jgi:hypothetical protein